MHERATALDYATRTVFAPPGGEADGELDQALDELVQSFGEWAVAAAVLRSSAGRRLAQGEERSLQILRQVGVLVMDAQNPGSPASCSAS